MRSFSLSSKAFGNPESLALTYLERIGKGLYEEAWAMEDATMQSLLSPGALQDMWEGMTGDLGNLRSFKLQRVEERGPYTLVFVVSSFERATLLAQVTVDKNGRISGLLFPPYTFSEYSPPPYAPREFVEREVSFGRPPIVTKAGTTNGVASRPSKAKRKPQRRIFTRKGTPPL